MLALNIDISAFLEKKWPSLSGYFVIAISLIVFLWGLVLLFVEITAINVPPHILLLLTFVLILGHDIVWRIKTGRVVLFVFNKIILEIHEDVLLHDPQLLGIIKEKIREGNVGSWFDVRVSRNRAVINSNESAEKHVREHKIGLFIWGQSITGLESGKEVTEYRLNFSYLFRVLSADKPAKKVRIKDFDEIIKERFWKVLKEDSLKEITTLAQNIGEVALYIIAICLLSRGDVNRGMRILESLYSSLKDRPTHRNAVLYSKLKGNLLNLYEVISIVEWREREDHPKSIAYANRILEIDPNNFNAIARIGYFEYEKGNLKGAWKLVQRIGKLNPRHSVTLMDMAFFNILDGKYKKAMTLYKKLERTAAAVDGLMAFEVANFLEAEYQKKKKEIGLLFAAGFMNCKFVGHVRLGLEQLKRFLKLAKNKHQYEPFVNKADAVIRESRNHTRRHKG